MQIKITAIIHYLPMRARFIPSSPRRKTAKTTPPNRDTGCKHKNQSRQRVSKMDTLCNSTQSIGKFCRWYSCRTVFPKGMKGKWKVGDLPSNQLEECPETGHPHKTNVFYSWTKRKPDYIKFPKFLNIQWCFCLRIQLPITAPTVNK